MRPTPPLSTCEEERWRGLSAMPCTPCCCCRLDNTAVGQRAILDNFGEAALPRTTWQIGARLALGTGRQERNACPLPPLSPDPFGHSGFQGVLSSALGGYNGVMWGREPADFKALSGCVALPVAPFGLACHPTPSPLSRAQGRQWPRARVAAKPLARWGCGGDAGDLRRRRLQHPWRW